MQIKLTRSGGIIPVTKKAEADVDWTDAQLKELRTHIEIKKEDATMRDHTTYTLSYNDESFPVDLDKLPSKHKKTFENLKDCLKIV